MSEALNNIAHVLDLVDLCHAKGVNYAVVCPGSRCAPLLLGFGKHPAIKVISMTDERSAGFVALGISQQLKAPVALVCTSGTAALNFSPAVAEAYYQNTRLVVLTADRPPELIDQWNGQTIHQNDIYAGHIQKSLLYTAETQAEAESVFSTDGPIHFNVPIREPFYPESPDQIGFSFRPVDVIDSESDPELDESIWQELNAIRDKSKSVMILAGQLEPLPELWKLLKKSGIPVVADICSNLQGQVDCVKSCDVKQSPEFLITIGRSIVSKSLRLYLRENKPKEHWHIGRGMVGDPFQSLTKVVDIEPIVFFRELNRRTLEFCGAELCSKPVKLGGLEYCGVVAVQHILKLLPEKSVLHLGNSLPVRIVDYLGIQVQNIEVWSNRGTSGIDGIVSTAVGHALADSERSHTLIVGDLSFLYDRNALWLNHDCPANLRIIVLNNGGGGIFDVVDGPSSQRDLHKLFTAPHNRSAELAAREFGLSYMSVRSLPELDRNLAKYTGGILEIFTDMKADAIGYKELVEKSGE